MYGLLENILPYSSYLKRLQIAGVLRPEEDIGLIISTILGIDDSALQTNPPQRISAANLDKIESAITAREKRIPVERIFKTIIFSGITLDVQKDVYKPYPETEDALIHTLSLFPDHNAALRILDLGTGSGCILLSLLKSLPRASGLGLDLSPEAIAAAQTNARLNNMTNRAEFRTNNWSDGITEEFDLVISNPPRVATSDIDRLLPEMRQHDPLFALDGGEDGMHFFRLLAHDFSNLVKPYGYGCAQTGIRYAKTAIDIFHHSSLNTLTLKTNPLGQPSLIVYTRIPAVNWLQKFMHWICSKF